MGSFSETCGISGTSIGYGNEKARLIFIAENKGGICRGCNCYPTDLWYPISFALDVTYDDYGRYKIKEDSLEWTGFRFFIAFEIYKKAEIERMEKENEVEPNKYSYFDGLRAGKDITTEQVLEMTPEKVFNMIHEGKLYLSDGSRVDKFAITGRVWDEWAIAPLQYEADGESFDIKHFISEFKKAIKEHVSRNTKHFKEDAYTPEQIVRLTVNAKARAVFEEGKYNYDIMDHDYPWDLVVSRNFTRTVKAKAELKMLVTKMDAVSKMFHPQKTSGGVDSLLYDLHNICANIAKEKHNDQQDEMGYPEKKI